MAEFDPTLTTLKYATYFGGAGDDTVTAMAIDGSGNIYMTGSTSTQISPHRRARSSPIMPATSLYPSLSSNFMAMPMWRK